MNKSRRVSFLFLGVFAGAALTAALDAATVTLPVSAAYPAGAGSNPGFVVRTVQAPQDAVVGNNLLRAIKQLNGTLSDTNGVAVANEAIPGANADGSYNVDLVNFEKDASPMDVIDIDNNVLASFNPDFFPGIPGTGGGASNFVAEVVTYLSLPAGTNTFGVSVGTDRTDVNDDDAFAVFVAANPRDFFATKVGEFQRSAPGFVVNTHTETQFTVAVTQAGVYPFRIVYWQTGNGANLQWYTVNNDTGERYLINDPAGPQTIKAYKEVASAVVKSPYVGEVSPPPGSDGNNPATAISAVIIDGATTVATSSVKLFLNGAAVTPQTLVKNGNKVSLQFAPNAARTDKNNLLRLEFADSASAKYTNSWSFGINPASGSSSTVAGQWDFDQGNLAATVGKPLQYLDGATGDTATKTKFGTTTALGIPDINGQVAKVMDVPGDLSNKIGYIMDHGISPNGGGTRVNQFTLIMDVMISPGAATSLINMSSPNNTDDGDLFWQGNNFGQGANGYNGTGAFTPGEWHRVVAAYDEAANPPVVAKFVDGIKQDDWTAGGGLDAARRTLGPTAVLFGDGDQDERHEMWVNSIQIRTGKISDAEAVLLGGPSATGIPVVISAVDVSSVKGQWDFDQGNLAATVGKPLQYLDGAGGLTETGTKYGTTTDLGLPDINGQVAKVMDIPGDLSNK
ncbi:MAG TPA: hypothetical protein VHH73_18410, partial [Verrucomicrobiae bacterium]|nr:hypothetical protein [Verrucomicrobiae bacterium]